MDEQARYVLVGGGPTTAFAAQTIREHDPDGRIVVITAEPHPPYEKPPLSKQFLAEDDHAEEDAYAKDVSFYAQNHVELRTGSPARSIDRAARTVDLANGSTVHYERLLLATGATPRALDCPGSGLTGLFYLRRVDEALAIREAIRRSRRATMIGAGYIGMEVASGCLASGLDVDIVEMGDHPWPRFASPTLGGFLQRYYEQHGARIRCREKVAALAGTDALKSVQLASGTSIPADMAVAGIGATLNLDLARSAGLDVDDREGVLVDEFLRTSDPSIWAAGDIACFQDVAMGERWHLEHHLNAKWQGRAVGAIMAGVQEPYDKVPYFFSDMLDIHMILRGHTGSKSPAQTRILGDLDAGEFIELYPDDQGRLRMGVAFSHDEKHLDPVSDRLEELIRTGAPVAELDESAFEAARPAQAA